MEQRIPDPERQRTGRLGALTVHARGRTNTGPARAAWEQALAAEFNIGQDAPDRQRRLDAALKVKMTRLAMARWKKRTANSDQELTAPEVGRHADRTAAT